MSPSRRRTAAGTVLILALALGGIGYVVWRALPSGAAPAASLNLTRPGTLVFLDETDHRVRQTALATPDQPIGIGPACQRVYAAAGTLICLRPAAVMGFEAAIFDRNMVLRKSIDLWGTPSRARVSPSGRLVAWTVFHAGDSYLRDGEFSTIAGIYDMATEAHYGSLEDFTATVDGVAVTDAHVNYWGITFAADDRTFYATMAVGERTWLMRGDLTSRNLVAIHSNVECPSLSPDGRRIAYKKRLDDRWRLHVLDLASGRETPLAEAGSIDDQAAWLDDATVTYARTGGSAPEIFAVPADGSGTPHLLRRSASSPSLNRA